MKNLLLQLAICSIVLMSCNQPKPEKITTTVTSHDHVTIVCSPKGNNHFPSWGVFPSKSEQVRRIFMDLTLGHPDSIKIAHWDYLDHITIRRAGGVKGDSLNLELGRMLTPYGSNFKQDWEWKWRIDVTDFAPILRDSIEVEYNHSGYESKEVGWDLNISFEITLGDLVAEVVDYKQIYNGSFSYGDPDKPITESLSPVEFEMDSTANFARIRVQHTGHGMDAPKYCSEFCSRWREILVDDKMIDHRDMWKECGDNNLYPQGGTWIFDRAYWCPGDLQKPDLIDFPITKTKHVVDFEIEPYVASDRIQANESINAILFQYKNPEKQFDAAIEQILVPNDAPELNRLNPSCFEPRIIIRNLGSELLQTLTIFYGTEGFETKSHTWIGELDFYQEEVIVLPGMVDFNFGKNVFFVELSEPNGEDDQWEADNSMEVNFSSPKEMPEKMVLTYKSNNQPEDNTIQIFNEKMEVVYERTAAITDSNTVYNDTLMLPEGNYRIALQDTAHNGLEFWFMPEFGFGYMYLSDMDGQILHRFESDCGVGEQLDFTTELTPRIDTTVEQSFFMLHPRRISTNTELMVHLKEPASGKIDVLADGDTVKVFPFTDVKNKTFDLNLEDLKDGRYVIELYIENESKLKQRIMKSTKKR